MDPLVWLAAVAAVLVALHVAIAAYLYRRADAGDGASWPREGEGADPLPQREADAAETADHRVACPACSVPNDPSYRFCRRCIADLSSNSRGASGPDAAERLES